MGLHGGIGLYPRRQFSTCIIPGLSIEFYRIHYFIHDITQHSVFAFLADASAMAAFFSAFLGAIDAGILNCPILWF
jgi:hypothetical protein